MESEGGRGSETEVRGREWEGSREGDGREKKVRERWVGEGRGEIGAGGKREGEERRWGMIGRERGKGNLEEEDRRGEGEESEGKGRRMGD